MCVQLHEEADGKILVLNLSGKLDTQDYTHFVPEVEQAILEKGKVRLLVLMYDFHGWTMGAVREDMKFDFHHFSQIERLALVGDSRWDAAMAVFCRPFPTATIRYFDESKAGEAAAWIHDGIAQPVSAA